MAALTTQLVDQDGLVNPTMTACATGGDTCQPGDRALVVVRNADASPHDFAIDDPRTRAPAGATAFNPDVTVNVPAGQTAYLGPLKASRFRNNDGTVHIVYPGGDVTSLTIAVLNLDD